MGINIKETPKSHAYIVVSEDETVRGDTALKLALSFLCEKGGREACGVCAGCRRALAGTHPDLVTVERKADDKGKMKREITVEQIRRMVADAYARPQEAERKVYIVREAHLLNMAAQNAALKILEEPPAFDVFILCAESAETLLPTLRSRCVVVRAGGKKTVMPDGAADEYLRLAAKRDRAGLCLFMGKCESFDRERLTGFLAEVRAGFADALCGRKKEPELSGSNAVGLLSLCDRAGEYLRFNVGPKYVLGMLCALK